MDIKKMKGGKMAREIKKTIFYAKELYKKTRAVEADSWTDFARYLCTLRNKRYTKPSLYWVNLSTMKNERISYKDLYNYIKKYGDKSISKKFKKLFHVS